MIVLFLFFPLINTLALLYGSEVFGDLHYITLAFSTTHFQRRIKIFVCLHNTNWECCWSEWCYTNVQLQYNTHSVIIIIIIKLFLIIDLCRCYRHQPAHPHHRVQWIISGKPTRRLRWNFAGCAGVSLVRCWISGAMISTSTVPSIISVVQVGRWLLITGRSFPQLWGLIL